jgi:hypothetical protein
MSLTGVTIYSLSKLASMHLHSSMLKFSMPKFSPAEHGGLDEKTNFKHRYFTMCI